MLRALRIHAANMAVRLLLAGAALFVLSPVIVVVIAILKA